MAPQDLPEVDFERVGPPLGARLDDIVLPNQHSRLVDVHAVRGNRRGLLVVFRSAGW
jgi:hypothetical protein